MSQAAAAINTKLIDSLAQIILYLTDEEQQLLLQKIQHLALAAEEIQRQREVLKRDIELGMEQLIPFFFIRVTTNTGLASIRAWMSVMDLEIWYQAG